jgi:crotonobetainyl-CoA:carnitine CoA-transferase CaiB-like acyl-CoA transferase
MTPLSRLAEVTGSPALANFHEDESFERREEIAAVVAEAVATRTTQEWLNAFRPAGIWSAPVNDYSQVVADPQVLWNRCFLEFDHPRAGDVRVLNHPIRYDGDPPPLRRRPPLLGEDTDEVLRELGYSSAEVEKFRADGVV